MKLDRLCVNTVFQYPAFVVISAQPQLLMLYPPVVYAKTNVRCHVLAAIQR